MKKISNFIEDFSKAAIGEDVAVVAARTMKGALCALKSHVASFEGDTGNLEANVESAKSDLDKARVNFGGEMPTQEARESYVGNLLEASNRVTKAEFHLEQHNASIKFLEGEYSSLLKESEALNAPAKPTKKTK